MAPTPVRGARCRSAPPARAWLKHMPRSAEFRGMPTGLFDILLVMVGASCMAGGFFIGSWHRRAAQRDEVDASDLASDERMSRMIRSLIHDDVVDDERPN